MSRRENIINQRIDDPNARGRLLQLPSLQTREGFDQLKEAGYEFNLFDGPKNLKPKSVLQDSATEQLIYQLGYLASGEIGLLNKAVEAVEDVTYLVADVLLKPHSKLEFFTRYPESEINRFAILAFEAHMCDEPLELVCPVCPDYIDAYRLSDGVGRVADKALAQLQPLAELFSSRNIPVSIRIDVADVEAFDPSILAASGETTESFLAKTAETQRKISEEIAKKGFGNYCSVGSMTGVFEQAGVSYAEQLAVLAPEILVLPGKPKRVLDALLAERTKLGDFDDLSLQHQRELAASELAGYATYGELVSGGAVIMSPDAYSAVPAYNFFRPKEFTNPVIYVK